MYTVQTSQYTFESTSFCWLVEKLITSSKAIFKHGLVVLWLIVDFDSFCFCFSLTEDITYIYVDKVFLFIKI